MPKYTDDEELQKVIEYALWRDPLKGHRAKVEATGTWEDVAKYKPNFPNWVKMKRKPGSWVAYWAGHSSEVGPALMGKGKYTLYFDGSTAIQGYESVQAAMDAGLVLLILVGEKEGKGK